MTQRISQVLQQLEQQHQVRVLLAVESGSRAWGFASSDSDWDIRFIYVHPVPWYVSVVTRRDVIECMLDDRQLDLSGWDLRKALALLRKSNPSLHEWLHSPIIYQQDQTFMQRITALEGDYFNPRAAFHHYLHIAINHNERYLQRHGVQLKRFLYFLRGLLACQWVATRRTTPPVLFSDLVDATVNDNSVRHAIGVLLQLKQTSKEHNNQPVDPYLIDYANQLSAQFNDLDTPPDRKAQGDTLPLDTLLLDMATATCPHPITIQQ